VFRSLAPPGDSPGLQAWAATHVNTIARAATLVVVIATVIPASPHPGLAGRGLLITIMLGAVTVACVTWILTDRWPRVSLAALIMVGLAAGILSGLSPDSPAIAASCMVVLAAGSSLTTFLALGIVASTVAAYLAAGLSVNVAATQLIGYTVALAGLWAVGLTRRAFVFRAQQAELMLAETRRAREAETQAAALAERARIAREIHDVLAHSLGAVSVNLQAAEGLLTAETLPVDHPELAQALACVQRAATLTRDGLASARRAMLALREDAIPLPDQLTELAGQYRETGDLKVDLTVTGPARPLPAEVRLAAFRTAQEALTNVRKHAPGQPVALALGYEPGNIVVRVVNPLPDGTRSPLATTGAGYGLTGLRERAELAGGSLDAGPADGNWQVTLRIPA